MRIDAHQHFWLLARGDYDWLTKDMDVLYRDYLPNDLAPHLTACQMDRTIVVQAAPTVEETTYLLELYDQYAFIAGVVGWLDLEAEHFPMHWKRLNEHKGFVGIRPMLQDLEDDRWILKPEVMKNVGILEDNDFPIDLLVQPRHLPYILALLQAFPTLRAVIDHAAKPCIVEGEFEPWATHLEQIAEYPNVMCKLSGLITEADHQTWTVKDLSPYVQQVVHVFGPEKIMFGSDWPVCRLAGEYEEVYQSLLAALPPTLSRVHYESLFGGNAARFYKLDSFCWERVAIHK